MNKKSIFNLSRRERQIMDIVYQKGEVAASEIEKLLPGSPSNSSVRSKIRVLEEKGYLKHKEKNLRYVYYPTMSRERVKYSALHHLIKTFFEGSPENVIAAIFDSSETSFTSEELDRIARLIKQAKKEGK